MINIPLRMIFQKDNTNNANLHTRVITQVIILQGIATKVLIKQHAEMAELADALDSKSS